MIKVNKGNVEIKGKADDLVSELTEEVHGFIEELSKDKEHIDGSSLLFRSFLFYIQKDAESHGLDIKITEDEMKDFEKKYKESREMAEKVDKLIGGLIKLLDDSDDDDDDDDTEDDFPDFLW